MSKDTLPIVPTEIHPASSVITPAVDLPAAFCETCGTPIGMPKPGRRFCKPSCRAKAGLKRHDEKIRQQAILPYVSGRSPEARQCSYLGAVDAQGRAARQRDAYVALLGERGPLTDQEAADLMGVERSSINARRNELGELVTNAGRKMGQRGSPNTLWRLTSRGRAEMT